MSSELPDGWTSATVADISDVQLGRQRSPQHHAGKQMRPYVRAANVTWQGIYLNDVKQMNFDDADFEKYKLASGDILLNEASGSPNEVGKPAIWSNEIEGCCFQNTLLRLRPQFLNRDYLYWYCYASALAGRFGEAGRGVNIRHLGKRGLSQFPIPVAPLAEQSRIVAAIEEHFSRLDAVESALTAAQRRLDALLQSALRSSCEGSWATRPLSDIIKSLKNGVFVSRPSAKPPGYPIYRISAVRPLQLRVEDIRYVSPVPDGASTYAVEVGDVLFTRYSGNPNYVGAAAVVPPDGAGVLHPDKLIRVIADRDSVLPEWIAAYVTAGTGRREVEQRLKTTAGQVGISGSQLRTVPVAVPPISYQQQAVDKIAAVLAERERIRQTLSVVKMRVEALRQSILSEAFAGKLVAQDPNDEPARVLLERIAASRAAKPKRQKVIA